MHAGHAGGVREIQFFHSYLRTLPHPLGTGFGATVSTTKVIIPKQRGEIFSPLQPGTRYD
jgi:hypothetical protein